MNNKSIYQRAPGYCAAYFDLVETDCLLKELEKSRQNTIELFSSIPPEKETYAYQPNKWTIKEVLRHIIDAERIYAYRALRLSRFDDLEFHGFDQEKYMDGLRDIAEPLDELLEEYSTVRQTTLSLFKPMTDQMLDFQSKSGTEIYTARAMGFMAVGHNLHHNQLTQLKYLK